MSEWTRCEEPKCDTPLDHKQRAEAIADELVNLSKLFRQAVAETERQAAEIRLLRSHLPVEAVDITTCEILLGEIRALSKTRLPEDRPALLHSVLHSHGIVQLTRRAVKRPVVSRWQCPVCGAEDDCHTHGRRSTNTGERGQP